MSRNKITKSTYLEGYYATGDYQCFCFDTHKGPSEHRAAQANLPEDRDRDECRTYPGDLLDKEMMGRRGRWTINVEFEPYEEPAKN